MITNYTRVLLAIISTCKNWPSVIFAKISGTKIRNIVLKNGFMIYMNEIFGKADLSMFSEIFYKTYYNPQGFEIQEHDVVFDVGANNGFFTFYASQKATAGRVYSFEPLTSLTEKIKRTLLLNNIKHVHVENVALGSESIRQAPFYISKNHNGCHSLYKRDGETEKTLVDIVGFEKYCKDHAIERIDFLKLDCEGAEYDILSPNTMEFIKKTVKKISMEYHDDIPGHSHEEILSLLSVHGFTGTIAHGYLYAPNNNLHNE